MQDHPNCFGCTEPVTHDPIFEAPCGYGDGHAACRSAVYHPMCLMKHRENVEAHDEAIQAFIAALNEELCPHGHRRGCDHHDCED